MRLNDNENKKWWNVHGITKQVVFIYCNDLLESFIFDKREFEKVLKFVSHLKWKLIDRTELVALLY